MCKVKLISLTFGLLLLISHRSNCQSLENLKGDLYFVLIDYMRFMDTPDSLAHVEEKEMIKYDSIHPYNEISKLYRELKKRNLLREPHIDLIDEEGRVSRVFVNLDDYNKMEQFKCWDLIDRGEKVAIQVSVKKIEMKTSITFYKALGHLSYQVVSGKTQHN